MRRGGGGGRGELRSETSDISLLLDLQNLANTTFNSYCEAQKGIATLWRRDICLQ